METEMLEIIIRVLKGEASPDDKQKLTAWLAQDQANLEIFRQSESVWNGLDIIKTGIEYDSEKAFNLFKEKVGHLLKTSRRDGLNRTIDWFLRIAAVLVILVGITYFFLHKPEKQNIGDELASCEIIAPRGSKTELLLPDGTKVWLNAESKIHYFNNFNRTDREVYLEGEGYFEVAKNPDRPFVVNTSNLKIKALGTIFNVKSYSGEETVEATLIEGKIVVENTASKSTSRFTTLEPNQKVTFYKNKDFRQVQNQNADHINTTERPSAKIPLGQAVVDKIENPSLITSWKDNMIFFDNEEFQDLTVRLERRFGVNIYFIDEDLKKLRFTGKFQDNIIEQILAALQFASPFYYSFNDKDIYISAKPIKEIPSKSNLK